MQRRFLRLTLSVSFMFLIYSSLFATNYYVTLGGKNTNTGLTWAQSFETIQTAIPLLKAGDSVLVQDGFYAGFDIRGSSGTAANPIVFKGVGDNVGISTKGPLRSDGINVEGANFIVIDHFIVMGMTGTGNGIRLVNAHNCVVRNCLCDNNAERGIFTGFTNDILIEYNHCSNAQKEHGIYVSNSSDRPIIRFNECDGNKAIGIHMNGDISQGGDGIISDAQVYGNYLHDNMTAAGINMDGVVNALVYNNLIVDNHNAQGIALFRQDGGDMTHGIKIYNNTIVVPSDGRWGILVMKGANVNTEIYNNIIMNHHSWRGSVTCEDTVGFKSDFNILNDKMSNKGDGSAIKLSAWQNLGYDANSILAKTLDDIFDDSKNNLYNLMAGSQAVDIGTSMVGAVVKSDINGVKRPQNSKYDIGAYELQTMGVPHAISENVIAIYPNPVINGLHFKVLKQGLSIEKITLYDHLGQLIKEIDHQDFMEITDIPMGTYLVHVYFNDHTTTSKSIVIE